MNQGTVQCPPTITAEMINPTQSPTGWHGGRFTGTLFNLDAGDGTRMECIYQFNYPTIAYDHPTGTKCVANQDRKSFTCRIPINTQELHK
jgi:hypothetical protein